MHTCIVAPVNLLWSFHQVIVGLGLNHVTSHFNVWFCPAIGVLDLSMIFTVRGGTETVCLIRYMEEIYKDNLLSSFFVLHFY